jgi:hypothetical protein
VQGDLAPQFLVVGEYPQLQRLQLVVQARERKQGNLALLRRAPEMADMKIFSWKETTQYPTVMCSKFVNTIKILFLVDESRKVSTDVMLPRPIEPMQALLQPIGGLRMPLQPIQRGYPNAGVDTQQQRTTWMCRCAAAARRRRAGRFAGCAA